MPPEGDAFLRALTLLLALRAAEGHDHAPLAEPEVGDIERDELGAAEGAREAEEQQRAIARR